MQDNDKNLIVENWIKLQYLDVNSPERERLFSAHMLFDQKVENDIECAFSLILEILEKDNSIVVVRNLAAGPMENLLHVNGLKIIGKVVAEARRNAKFRYMLGGVWKGEILDEVWSQIEGVRTSVW